MEYNSNCIDYKMNPNPLNLPANTVRVRTNNGLVPVKDTYSTYQTATLVEGTTDVYDVYKSGDKFSSLLYRSTNVVEVLGANTSNITDCSQMFDHCSSLIRVRLFDTSNVTNMYGMFMNCSNLTNIPLFDTSNVTDMENMFYYCSNLTYVPLLNTNSVVDMDSMFSNCTNVESGALALYQQASSQTTPPAQHIFTFMYCGSNTQTGAAELAQIPSDWK